MREIKFRGWDEELKKWHYGNYYFYTDTIYCMASEEDNRANEHHCILFDGFCDWNMQRPHYKAYVNGETIGQYTGLKDKKGVEIYEGDIIHGTIKDILSQGYQNGIVKWGSYGFVIDLQKQPWEPGIGIVGFGSFTDYEVIGNVHQCEVIDEH